MILYIAEKPSMAAEIAKCLPGSKIRKDGYIIAGDIVVTWVFGHILRQAEPGEYDTKYERWRVEDLPIIPDTWKLLVAKSCEKQFEIIKMLIEQASEIVHAGDPDREGQLLIDEVLDFLHNKKTVKRILLNALDERSIKKALEKFRTNEEFYNLKQSALARSRADWLIGMNLSRAYTLAAQKAGHRVTLPVGRVKTPTLALVVRREREIEAFKGANYFTVKADFEHVNGKFTTYWKPKETQAGLDSEGRLADASVSEALMSLFSSTTESGHILAYDTLEKKDPQRLPLALSTLQVIAGKKHGYEPQLVLDTAQKLYERKLTTYPRSDCEYLPESQHSDGVLIIEQLKNIAQNDLASWANSADTTIKSRAFNDKQITAHHAIIPTVERCNFVSLSEIEKNIYFIIAQTYLSQFHPIHIYNQTRVEVGFAGEIFTASGRTVLQAGWKVLYGADADENKEEDNSALPLMSIDDEALFLQASSDKKATKPPVRFTAATLLAAMKEIHKYVKNPELKKQLKDVSGIGTEATRATIIKELIDRNFLSTEKKKKYLKPTEHAYLLIDALPEEITYPDYTAIWEDRLYNMANGSEELTSFLDNQTQFTTELCNKANNVSLPLKGDHICPECGQGVLQEKLGKNGKFWGCSAFPSCRASFDDDNGVPKKPKYICPRCKQGSLNQRNGKNGKFWGCSKYPHCKATFNDIDNSPALPPNMNKI